MSIRIDKWFGTIPHLDPARLPDGAGQICHGFAPSSGVLSPLVVQGPYTTSHNEDGTLKAGIPAAEVVEISKPVTPTLNSRRWLCIPCWGTGTSWWLKIWMYCWLEYIDANGGRVCTNTHGLWFTNYTWDYTESGLNIYLSGFTPGTVTMPRGGPYYFRGPRFLFEFKSDTSAAYAHGGPAVTQGLPALVFPSSPVFSSNHVALYGADGNVYAEFRVNDYAGPLYDEEFMIENFALYSYYFQPFACCFRVNLNYAQPKRQHYYYASSFVDATESEREGPPSEISAHLIARPGEVLKLNFPQTGLPSGGVTRVYRSGTGTDDFLKVKDLASGVVTFEDAPDPITAEEIPPFGNYTSVRSGITKTDLIEGSLLHPAQFGVAFDGKTTWHSDRFRLHAWPEENTMPYQENIVAIALAGDTTLVFTTDGETPQGGSVYAETGGDPSNLSQYCISRSHPILNKQSLCQIGNTVYWVTWDGIAACRGSNVEIVTREYLTRNEWLALDPAGMKMSAADNCLYCEAATMVDAVPPSGGDGHYSRPLTMVRPIVADTTNTLKIRFDLRGTQAALTTYSVATGGAGTHLTKLYVFDRDTTFDVLRLCASGTVTVTATVDGVALTSVPIASDAPTAVSWPHGRHWEFKLVTAGGVTIREFEAHDRVVQPGQDMVEFTAQTTPTFEDMRVRWPQAETLAAAYISYDTVYNSAGVAQASPTIRLYAGRDQSPEAFLDESLEDSGDYHQIIRVPLQDRETSTDFHARVLNATNAAMRVERVVLAREVDVWPDGIIEEGRGPIPAWLVKAYRFKVPTEMRSVRVVASSAVTMRLFYDDETEDDISEAQEIAIAGPGEYRVKPMDGDRVKTFTSLRYDFVDGDGDPANDLVSAVTVATSQPMEAPQDGVHLTGGAPKRRQVYRFQERALYSAVSVLAEDYPLKLNIYPAGYATHGTDASDLAFDTIVIPDAKPVALPWWRSDGDVDDDAVVTAWEFDLRDNGADDVLLTRVEGFHLYPRVGVAVQDSALTLTNLDGRAPWLMARYESDRERQWYSFCVDHDGTDPVYMRLYLDGTRIDTNPLLVVQGCEQYLGGVGVSDPGRILEFRFFLDVSEETPADHLVSRVSFYSADPTPVSGPVTITGKPWLNREFQFGNAGLFTAAQVVVRDAFDGHITLRLKNTLEGETAAVVPTTDKAFALPLTASESARWVASLEHAGANLYAPDAVSLTLYPERTVAVTVIDAQARPSCPDWLQTLYEFAEPQVLSSLWVESDSYPVTVEATVDGLAVTKLVEAAGWVTTGWTTGGRQWRVRITDGAGAILDHLVRRVRLLPQIEMTVGPDDPVVLTDDQVHGPVRLRFPVAGGLAGLSVDADTEATVTVTDGTRVATATVAANTPGPVRLLASGETEAVAVTAPVYSPVWTVTVACTGRVRNIVLLPWRFVEAGKEITWQNRGGLPQWFWSRYVTKEAQVVRSGRIYGAGTSTVYAGATAQAVTYTSGIEFRFDTRREGAEFCVVFGTPASIVAFGFAFEEHLSLDSSGLLIRQAEGQWCRNKVVRLGDPGAIDVVCAVGASSLKLKPYGDSSWKTTSVEAPAYEAVVSSPEVAPEFELDIVHTSPVTEIRLFSRASREIGDGPLVLTRSGLWSWLGHRVTSKRPVKPVAVMAQGSKDIRVRAYDHGRSSEFTETVYHSSIGTIQAVSDRTAQCDWVFDIDANGDTDEEVDQVVIWFEQTVTMPVEGVLELRGGDCYVGIRVAAKDRFALSGILVDSSASATVTITDGTRIARATAAANAPAFLRLLETAEPESHAIQEPSYATDYVMSVTSLGVIRSVTLLAWVQKPCDGTIRLYGHSGIQEWWHTRYTMSEAKVVRSVLMHGLADLDIYTIGTLSPLIPVRWSGTGPRSSEFRLDESNPDSPMNPYECRELVLNLVAVSGSISLRRCVVACEDEVPIGPGGILLRPAQREMWRNIVLAMEQQGRPIQVRMRGAGTVKFRQAGALNWTTATLTIPSDEAVLTFDPTDDYPASRWEVDVVPTTRVTDLAIWTDLPMDIGDGVVTISRGHEPHTWTRRRLLARKATRFVAARIVASGAVTLTLTSPDGLTSVSTAIAEGDLGRVVAVSGTTMLQEWVMSAGPTVAGTPTQIQEVRLYQDTEIEIPADGVLTLSGDQIFPGLRLKGQDLEAWAVAKVDSDAATTVTLTAIDASYVATATVDTADQTAPVRLYSAGTETVDQAIGTPTRARLWTLGVSCAGTVRSLTIAAWRTVDAGPVIEVNAQGWAWMRTRYKWGQVEVPRSVMAIGAALTSAMTVSVYCGTSAEVLTWDGTSDPLEQRIATAHPSTECVIDILDASVVRTVLVGIQECLTVEATGLVVRQAKQYPLWRRYTVRFTAPGMFGVARAREAVQVRLRPYATGDWTEVDVASPDYTSVIDYRSGTLPSNIWELDVALNGPSVETPLNELVLTTRAYEMVGDGPVSIVRGQVETMLDRRYAFRVADRFAGIRVVTAAAPDMGSTSEAVKLTFRDSNRVELYHVHFRAGDLNRFVALETLDRRVDWVLDVEPDTDAVSAGMEIDRVELWPQREVRVEAGGVVRLENLPLVRGGETNGCGTRILFDTPGSFAGVYVDADASATVSLKAGSYTATAVVTEGNEEMVRVKSGTETEDQAIATPTKATEWLLRVTCAGTVRSVTLVAWGDVPCNGMVSYINQGGIAPWLHSRWVLTDGPRVWRSLRITGTSTVALYIDGTKVTCSPTSGVEYRLDTRYVGKELVLVFGTSKAIQNALVGCEQRVAIGQGGNVFRQGEQFTLHRNLVFEATEPVALGLVGCRHGTEVRVRPYNTGDFETVSVAASDYTGIVAGNLVAQRWEIDPVSTEPVDEIYVITRGATPIGAGPVTLRRMPDITTWLDRRFVADLPMRWLAVRVIATGEVTLSFRTHDRTLVATKTVAAAYLNQVVAVTGLDLRAEWVVDAVPTLAATEIEEVALYPERDVMMPPDGVLSLADEPCYSGVRVTFAKTGSFAGVRVDADAEATVTLTDGVNVLSATVTARDLALKRFTSGGGHTIASPLYGPIWTLGVTCAGRVRSVTLLAWVDEGCDGNIGWVEDGRFPAWFNRRYRLQQAGVPRSVLITGTSTMDVYADGTQISLSPTPGVESRIDTRYTCKEIVLDFGTPNAVKTVLFGCEETVTVGPEGFVLRQARGGLWRNKRFEFTQGAAPSLVGCRRGIQVRIRPYNTGLFDTVAVSAPSYVAIVPSPDVARTFEIDFVAAEGVEEVSVFTRCATEIGESPIVLRRSPESYTFLDRRFTASKETRFAAVSLVATGAVTVSLRDHSRTLLDSVEVSAEAADGRPVALPWIDRRMEWVVDVVGAATTEIEKATLYPEIEVVVPETGIVPLQGLPHYCGIRLRGMAPVGWAAISVDADTAAEATLSDGTNSLVTSVAAETVAFARVGSVTDPVYADTWTLDVACQGVIRDVTLLAWQDVQSDGMIGIVAGGLPLWMRNRYRWGKTRSPRSYRLIGSDATLYCDGTAFALTGDDAEQRLDDDTACLEAVLDVTTPESLRSVLIGCEEHVPVEPRGIVLRRTDHPLMRNLVLRLNEAGSFGVVVGKGATRVRVRQVGGTWGTWLELSERIWSGILPAETAGFEWELDLEYDQLRELMLFTRAPMPVRDGAWVIRRDRDPYTWMDKRVEVARPVAFDAMRVIASGEVVVAAMERDRTVIWTMTVSGTNLCRGIRVPRADARRDWVLDAVGAETTEIQEVVLASSMDTLKRV